MHELLYQRVNQGRRYKRGHFSLLASYNNNLKITPKTPKAATFLKKNGLLVPVGATNRKNQWKAPGLESTNKPWKTSENPAVFHQVGRALQT